RRKSKPARRRRRWRRLRRRSGCGRRSRPGRPVCGLPKGRRARLLRRMRRRRLVSSPGLLPWPRRRLSVIHRHSKLTQAALRAKASRKPRDFPVHSLYVGDMAIVFDQAARDLRAARHPEKAHRPDSAVQRKPDWIRVKAPGGREFSETKAIVREHGLHTVCEEAGCPNIGECWTHRHATMMIMGDTCTRACAFCNVKTGLPGPLDEK